MKRTVISLLAGIAAAAGISTAALTHDVKQTSAYFTDTEFHTNSYTFGDITIDGTERTWKPEQAKHLVPLQVVAKDPRLENTGTNLAAGFIVLDSPIVHQVELSDDEGHLLPKADVESFRFLNQEHKEGFNTSHWTLIKTEYLDAEKKPVSDAEGMAKGTFKRYIFGYKDALPGGSAEHPVKTDSLFDFIQAQNYVEGSLPGNELSGIDVYFLAIQAENLKLSDGAVTTEANTKNMNESMLKDIYQIIANRADFKLIPEADTANRLNLAGGILPGKE